MVSDLGTAEVQSSPCDQVTGTSQGWIHCDADKHGAPRFTLQHKMQLSSRQVSRSSVSIQELGLHSRAGREGLRVGLGERRAREAGKPKRERPSRQSSELEGKDRRTLLGLF